MLRYSPAALALLALSGCATFRIEEDNWFNPGFAALTDSARTATALAGRARMLDAFFLASDSTRLRGLLVLTPGASTTVLYFGGDNFRIATQGPAMAENASAIGVNAFLVDYRGYGESSGTPSINFLKQDALDAIAYLEARPEVQGTAVALHGYSMGSFLAAHVASRRPISGLVMESTATTVRNWARSRVPWYARPFVRISIAEALTLEDNRRRLAAYNGPLLILAGGSDAITPPAMARALFEAAASPADQKRLVIVAEAQHGDVLRHSEAQAAYRAFLANLRPVPSGAP